MIKECRHCKETFTPSRPNRMYCSYNCKGKRAHELRHVHTPRLKNYVQYNTENNITPLPGDVVRLSADYGRLKANTLGIIVGTVAIKTDEYKVMFNPILPPFISVNKQLNVESGVSILIKKDSLLHSGKTNMAFSYPDRKKADDMFLVNQFKTIL